MASLVPARIVPCRRPADHHPVGSDEELARDAPRARPRLFLRDGGEPFTKRPRGNLPPGSPRNPSLDRRDDELAQIGGEGDAGRGAGCDRRWSSPSIRPLCGLEHQRPEVLAARAEEGEIGEIEARDEVGVPGDVAASERLVADDEEVERRRRRRGAPPRRSRARWRSCASAASAREGRGDGIDPVRGEGIDVDLVNVVDAVVNRGGLGLDVEHGEPA